MTEDRFEVDASGARGLQVGDGNVQVNYFGHRHVVEWPLAVGVPPREAEAFQGRSDLRDAIRAGWAAGGPAAVTQVVVGDGGVGKTQLGAAVYRDALTGQVDLAVWATATDRAAVLSTYAQAYVRTHPGVVGETEEHAAAFLGWLAATPRRWLVVLDDVADPADLVGLWPAGRGGQVLVTTRRRDAAVSGRLVDVGVFTRAEAVGYLDAKLTAAGGRSARALDGAEPLVADLGHLPLALSHAAAVIVNDGITCADYRELLSDRRERLDEILPSYPGDEYAHTVAGAWSLARDRADALSPAGLAGPMLALVSVLDPNGIPEAVLISDVARAHLREPQPGAAAAAPAAVPGAAAARRALRNLWRLSLISHDPDDECRSVRIHALAQRAAVEQLNPEATEAVVRVAADALMSVWPQVEAGTPLGEVLRANATVLAGRDPAALRKPAGHHPLLSKLGNSLGEAGLVSSAIAHFTALSAEGVLDARYDLARWLGMSGDLTGAVTTLEQVASDMRGVRGPDDPRTLAARAELARWRGVAGDSAGAAAAMTDVVADFTRVLGPDHPDTLANRANLAYVLGEAKDWARAVAVLEAVLGDKLRVFGPDRPEPLVTRHMLACYRGEAGDAAGAVAGLTELVADRIRILGPDHPETLATRHELGRWRGERGDPTGAVAALELVLPDLLRVLGSDHPWTMGTRHELGRWLGEVGDAAAAVAALEGVLADRERVLSPDHPWTMGTRQELARWRGELGDPAGAVAALEDLLADRLRVLGPDHPDIEGTRASLAYWSARR